MVKFTADELRRIEDKKHNIRNISVIAHAGHGLLTLMNSLTAAAGINPQEVAGDVCMTGTRADEVACGITIKPTASSLYYTMTDMSMTNYKGERSGNHYLINMIDSHRHAGSSSEITAALRITDGALVVVDCMEGVSVQTETTLRRALGERMRPVLTVNKMDRCVLKLQMEGEEAYQTFRRVIENANVIMATNKDPLLGDVQVYPEKGTVAFSSGLHGWAFTLNNFAKLYAAKFQVDETKMMERLWGENYFDPNTKKWTSKHTGSPTCKRGFVLFCYEPIQQIINACMSNQKDRLWTMLRKLGVPMNADEQELVGTALMKRVMQKWLPASNKLLEMMILHLPSPAGAQKYRAENLYDGPTDDIYANAIRSCDPEGPRIMYVSNMIPAPDMGRFFASGRVLSGKVATGNNVRIMARNFVPGQKKDLYVTSVRRTALWMCKMQEPMEDVPCGNIVVCSIEESGLHTIATAATATYSGACQNENHQSQNPAVYHQPAVPEQNQSLRYQQQMAQASAATATTSTGYTQGYVYGHGVGYTTYPVAGAYAPAQHPVSNVTTTDGSGTNLYSAMGLGTKEKRPRQTLTDLFKLEDEEEIIESQEIEETVESREIEETIAAAGLGTKGKTLTLAERRNRTPISILRRFGCRLGRRLKCGALSCFNPGVAAAYAA